MANETKIINFSFNMPSDKKESLLINNHTKFSNKYDINCLVNKLEKMGFNNDEILRYLDSNFILQVENMIKSIEVKEKNAYIDVTDGFPQIIKEEVGVSVQREQLLDEIVCYLKSEKISDIKIDIINVMPQITCNSLENLTNLKSKFVSYIYGVNQEGRIQNIKQAAAKFNGKILMPGERLSFNTIIGETTLENGYALAKVILNGKYEEDYGGGVCQVASTLYNAALIAGLKVDRVAPHSLKVGYVAGSFDAMVSSGVSDLIISNPLETPVYIHSYATDYECGFKIYGEQNQFEIVRRTEILEINEEEKKEIAFKSEGYLDYYKDGVLVETKLIRKDKYKK